MLNRLLKIPWSDVLEFGLHVEKYLAHIFQSQGLYEVLDYDAQLEILDPKGKRAIFSKRQRVCFLQDNIIAYQDQAWGDGNIFAKYKCSPGIPVDRYQEGNRYRILISFRETKNYGDIAEFQIERHIEDGFVKQVSFFQNKIDHRTKHFSTSVVFPAARLPRQIRLIEHNANRATPLDASQIQTLPDGRQQVTWRITRPRLFELYSIRWRWLGRRGLLQTEMIISKSACNYNKSWNNSPRRMMNSVMRLIC